MKNHCVNTNSKEFKAILEKVKNPLLAEIEYLKTYQEDVDIVNKTTDYENYTHEILKNGINVGYVKTENDGMYLNIQHANIKNKFQGKGIGKNAYRKIGEWADSIGLQLRSHIEMHAATIKLWEGLVREGLAVLGADDRYYFTQGNQSVLEKKLESPTRVEEESFVEKYKKELESGEIILNCS